MKLIDIYRVGRKWFLAPGYDWRTWIGHSLVVGLGAFIGGLIGTAIIGWSLVGFYFWREVLEQVMPKVLSGAHIAVIDSWFDVFCPLIINVVILALMGVL